MSDFVGGFADDITERADIVAERSQSLMLAAEQMLEGPIALATDMAALHGRLLTTVDKLRFVQAGDPAMTRARLLHAQEMIGEVHIRLTELGPSHR